ncbi:uncharacterized protein LOC111716294 isoform X2 [Eurytemora carolleeae]|uniref:uncharacterized protein LOC111716294 isoform X2 n=1 Tax=Eurytemora carolleeae TaxID=1294199 RepID=UPI000C755BF7|nr:uncharacterized protein LOC111716294 isoform X2 [Eurytemora carolleeae]|eukprot:XP_023347511.1 uncharacterized protein LOC111716294 isoform X2 [Eurytemora affinis]
MNQIKIIILLISLVLASSVILFLCLNPLCTEVEVFCPDPSYKFKTQTCCSVVWWSLGAGLGVGNECVINMDEMRSNCPMYDCYFKQTGEWNSNGCSYVPEMLLNENSCDIHDLCYITPGATKDSCDTSFVENIGRIYCNNVHFVEYLACRSRASIAGSVVQVSGMKVKEPGKVATLLIPGFPSNISCYLLSLLFSPFCSVETRAEKTRFFRR